MKSRFTFILLITCIVIMAQNQQKSEMIKVKTDKNIDPHKLSIKLSEGTWKINFYPIFQNNKILSEFFPKEAGIYNLIINYAENLFYIETVIYKTDPKLELLEFEFYKENERIFCKIKSEEISELNKEIVLNKFDKTMQDIIDDTKK